MQFIPFSCYFPPRKLFLHHPFLILFHSFFFIPFSCKARYPVSHPWFYVFRRFSQFCEKRMLPSSYLSVLPSEWNNSAPTGRSFMNLILCVPCMTRISTYLTNFSWSAVFKKLVRLVGVSWNLIFCIFLKSVEKICFIKIWQEKRWLYIKTNMHLC